MYGKFNYTDLSPAVEIYAITPGNGILSPRPSSIRATSNGSVTLLAENSTTPVTISVVAGEEIPIVVKKVTAATASLVAIVTARDNQVELSTAILNELSIETARYNITSSNLSIPVLSTTEGSTLALQSGSLPNGLSLSGRNIVGTPTTPGIFNFTIRESLNGVTKDTSLTLTIFVVFATLSLSDSSLEAGASATINILGGYGSSTITVEGTLPTGMSLSGRTITGTPSTSGTFAFNLVESLSGSTTVITPVSIVVSSDVITVSSISEWNTVFAQPASALANKTVRVTAALSGAALIQNKDFIAAGGPVTITTAEGASLARIEFSTLVNGVNMTGVAFQMTGWPRAFPAIVRFNDGSFDNLKWENCSFRHGYGPSLQNIDTSATLAEYERISNVRTATASSATYPLNWKDPAMTEGIIEFFNRGTNTVHVALGGPGVVASTGNLSVAPGARRRFNGVNPAVSTHFAVISQTGTSEVNARTEIGLGQYLSDCFNSVGNSVIENVELRNCTFTDVNNGVKGILQPRSITVMDCFFDRVYQDIITPTPRVGEGKARVLRNRCCVPFSRSGIPEGDNGDAGDPHGDVVQMFTSRNETVYNVIVAGNRMFYGSLRAGVNHQGAFISDNDAVPSYDRVYLISNCFIGGSTNQITSGEPFFPVRNVLVYGATIFKYDDPTSVTPSVNFVVESGTPTVYVGNSIAPKYINGGIPYLLDEVVESNNLSTEDRTAIFPNISQLATARTRAAIDTAITPAGAGVGKGAVATNAAIDWNTTDPEAVVIWDQVHSGVAWDDVSNQQLNTVITMPLRKVINPKLVQSVSAGAGTEWRSVDVDGVTELQGWTNGSGTIQTGQFIQVRRTSSTSAFTTVQATVTINGQACIVGITTGAAPVTSGFVGSSTNNVSSTNITVNVPTGGSSSAQAGDLLIVYAISSTGVEIDTPPGWVAAVTATGHAVRYLPSWNGETTQYTFTMPSSAACSIMMLVYRGYNWGVISTVSSLTANPTPAAITVPAANSINVVLSGSSGNITYAGISGFTSRDAVSSGRSIGAFERNALVPVGSLAGTTVTRATGTTSSRAIQFSLTPV